MSDIILQLNFTEGAGNYYSALTQAVNFAKFCNTLNYTVKLYYNYNKCRYINNIYYNIDNFFNINNFENLFIEINNTTPIYNIENYTYLYTPFLDKGAPGVHFWDFFLNNKNIEKKDFFVENALSIVSKLPDSIDEEYITIKLSNVLRKKSFENKNNFKNALHIRSQDGHDDLSIIKNNLNKIEDLLKEKLYICSNSLKIRDYFKLNTNAVIAEERHSNVGYHHYFVRKESNVTDVQLLENLEDTLIEMHNLSLCNNIYMISSYSNISSFLYYAINNNRKIKLVYI